MRESIDDICDNLLGVEFGALLGRFETWRTVFRADDRLGRRS